MVCILILIDQDVAKTRTEPRFCLGKTLNYFYGFHDQIIKVHGIGLAKTFLIKRINISSYLLKLIAG